VWAAAAKRDEAERALTQSKEVTHALREAAIEVEAQRREEAAEMARVAKTQREKQQAERKQQQLQAAAEAVSWKVLVHEIDQIDEAARLAAAAAAVRSRKARPPPGAQHDAAAAAAVQAVAEELAEANEQLLRLREKQRTQELKLDEQSTTSERLQLRVAALAQAANVAHAAFRTLMGSMEQDELATLPVAIRKPSMDAVEQPRQASELARAVAGGVSKRVDRLVRQAGCNPMHPRYNPMHPRCNPTHPCVQVREAERLQGEVVGAEEREREARRAARIAKEAAYACGYTCISK